jgi:hypothetical protein
MSIPLKLETLNGGGVIEAIEVGVQSVLDNIADPNTDAKKPREVNIKLKFKPNEQRNMGEVEATITTKLQPQAAQVVSIIIDQDTKGKAHAAEAFAGQMPDQHEFDNVHRIPSRKTGTDQE